MKSVYNTTSRSNTDTGTSCKRELTVVLQSAQQTWRSKAGSLAFRAERNNHRILWDFTTRTTSLRKQQTTIPANPLYRDVLPYN